MLSIFLAAFIHLALLGVAGYGHVAAFTPPTHHHMHTMDTGSGPPNS
jgi:hypothetical protein